MSQAALAIICVLFVFPMGCRTAADFQPAPSNGDWTLVWSDEFDGTKLDMAKWSIQIGDGCAIGLCGWGNEELQWYSHQNLSVADGKLTIRAEHDPESDTPFTSSRIRTLGKGDWKYGKVEVRAALPTGQGLWPAIWMMPSESVYGTWAASGEIDIMEALGHLPGQVFGTLHYGDRWPDNTMSGDTLFFQDSNISEFHTYAIEWEDGRFRWLVDDIYFGEQSEWNTKGHKFPAPFDQRFHLILNVAIGGAWPGDPDSTTVFPQHMVVDYVRVYQESASNGDD